MKRTAIGVLAIFLMAAGPSVAQDLSGRIEGNVTDATGLVFPGADVSATHVETNFVYRAITSELGRFVILKVRLGHYTVVTEMPGFRRAIVQDVVVEVGGTANLNITLQLGTLQEEVTVTSELTQQLVNTVDAELSSVVDNRQVLELPLNGRNASHLILQQAGVYFERSPDGSGNKLFVHGQRHSSLNISLDGVDTQDNLTRTSTIMLDQPLLALAAENVQELLVITGLSSAEFSRGGAQMAAVTRAGTNEFHGSVFWFHHNTVLNSNDFFNDLAEPKVERPPLLRHQFGARIGGPIISDKTFFFFGYQQTRQSQGIAVNRTVYTAEARQGIFRYLDNLRNTPENVAANPGLIRSVNLLECGSAIQGALGRDCVDERFDLADPATLDPFIGNEIFGLIPLPNNFDLCDGLNTGGFRFNSPSITVEHLPSFKLDHQFSDEHLFYGTFNYIDREIKGDFVNDRETPYPGQEPLGNRVTHSRGFSAALTSPLTPTFINDFRAGGLVHGENAFLLNQPFATPFTLDLNTITDPYDPSNNDEARDNDTYHIRNTVSWVRGNHQIKAGLEWRHRWVHTYSFDEVNPFGEIDLDDNNFPPAFSESNLRALSGGTDIESQDHETARDLMNNLVGAISEVEVRYNVRDLTSGFILGQPERRKYQNREFDVFFNDTWAFRPNLTLNFGLRWEYATVPYETQGLALTPEGGLNAVFGISGPEGFFNPGTFAGTPCAFLGTLPTDVTTSNARALITSCATQFVPGTSSNNRPLWDDDLNNFAPVIGLAWDPWGDGKSSVRAGFRISYMQDNFNIIAGNLDDNEGLRVDQDCKPENGECINNPLFLRDVLSTGPPIAPVPEFTLPSSRSILDSSTNDFRTYATNLATPYYEEWTLSLQREVLPNLAVDVRYVGNRGVKLRRVADFNEINIFARDSVTGMTFLESFIIAQQNIACNRAEGEGARFDDATGESCITPNPLMVALIAGDRSRLRSRSALVDALDFNEPGQFVHRLTQNDTSRPTSGESRIRGGSWWGAVLAGRFPVNFFQANPFVASARAMVNDGYSTYHALEVELKRRFSAGFTMQANYTFGKALADYDGDSSTLLNDVRPSSVRNPGSTVGQYMPRHQFNANWIYELPLGPNKAFNPQNHRLSQFLQGWQMGGIVNWRSGRPLSIESNRGTFHRTAISDANTVNLSEPLSHGELRDLVGRQTIEGGVFWLDPCLSSQIAGACSGGNTVSGLFQLPESGRIGELAQTVIYGPRRFTFDFNLAKRTQITENSEIEFRWEVFNAFNNTNFAAPTTDIFSINFGQVVRTITNPRLMQFALKVNF